MINWSNSLYIGETVFNKHKKLIKKIGRRKLTFGVYCITYASNTSNLFDIIEANQFLFPIYKKLDVCIIGIAGSLDEAKELVTDMLMEVYLDTGAFNVREYFN